MPLPIDPRAWRDLTAGLTPAQQNIVADLLPQLLDNVALGGITPAQTAQALERIAVHLRTAGQAATFALPAVFKPYVRMTQRSMHADPQAREYLASKMRIAGELQAQLDGRRRPLLPRSTPFAAYLELPRAAHNRDVDNEAKAALDASGGVLYPDDRWADYLLATRGEYTGNSARLTVGLLRDEL